MISGANYIGSKQSKEGTITYKTFNPKLNLETDWMFYEANKAEVNEAVSLAVEAFEVYKKISGVKKAKFLRTIAKEIESLGSVLVDTYSIESGLPEGRALGERSRTIKQLLVFAKLLEEGSWVEASIDITPQERSPIPKIDLRKMLKPVGPIVVFGASNFPLAFSTAGGDTVSALASGCPVIVKSHPMHAATGELVASAILKAASLTGMPNGVFSNLNSKKHTVGRQLVLHPLVKGVGFTGSIKGGVAISKMANEREEPIQVFAEMGSVNPVVILPSAIQDEKNKWANTYASSITVGAGQFCTNPGLILGIKGDLLNNFIDALGKEVSKVEPDCMLHPNIFNAYVRGKNELSAQKNVGIVVSYSGSTEANFGEPKVLRVLGAEFLQNPTLHREVFGPFSIVVECKNYLELENILIQLEGQLTGTILGNVQELIDFEFIVEALKSKVGRIVFNGVPTGVEVCSSMQHGGPFPATTDSRFTSVGVGSIKRWVRPVAYQNWPNDLLPPELQNENPLQITRNMDGEFINKFVE